MQVLPLQTGSAAGQSTLEVHPQLPLPVLHIGLTPVHSEEFVAEHCKHAPLTQAGSAAFGQASDAALPLSPLQA